MARLDNVPAAALGSRPKNPLPRRATFHGNVNRAHSWALEYCRNPSQKDKYIVLDNFQSLNATQLLDIQAFVPDYTSNRYSHVRDKDWDLQQRLKTAGILIEVELLVEAWKRHASRQEEKLGPLVPRRVWRKVEVFEEPQSKLFTPLRGSTSVPGFTTTHSSPRAKLMRTITDTTPRRSSRTVTTTIRYDETTSSDDAKTVVRAELESPPRSLKRLRII